MTKTSGLTVRQFRRTEVELEARFDVAEHHQSQVRFSPSSGTPEAHSVAALTIDVSPGGMGLKTMTFLPRSCEGTLRVFDPKPVGTRSDGTPILEVAFEHAVKVRRTTLTGHEPSYFVGVSFIDPEQNLENRIASLLERVGYRAPAADEGAGGDA